MECASLKTLNDEFACEYDGDFGKRIGPVPIDLGCDESGDLTHIREYQEGLS